MQQISLLNQENLNERSAMVNKLKHDKDAIDKIG
jgi:hypothetical protein